MSISTERAPKTTRQGYVVVFVNAKAHSGKDEALVSDRLLGELRARGLDGRVVTTDTEDACMRLVAEVAREGVAAIVAAGGDGTIRCIIRALTKVDEPRPALGIIPAGTMNNIAAAFGIPEGLAGALDTLAESLRTGRTVPMDVGFVNGEPFVEVTGTGLLADLFPLGEDLKDKGVRASKSAFTALREIVSAKPEPVKLWLDGRPIVTRPLQVTICNTPSQGARLVLSPSARVDDGLLDVVIDKRVSGPHMLWDLATRASMRHMSRQRQQIFQARSVVIEPAPDWSLQVDGSQQDITSGPDGRRKIEARVQQAMIQVCATRSPQGSSEEVAEPVGRTLSRLLPAEAQGVAAALLEPEKHAVEGAREQVEPPRRASRRLQRLRWLYGPGLLLGGAGMLVARRWALLPGDVRIVNAIQKQNSPALDTFMTAVAAPGFPPLSLELVGAGVATLWLLRLRLEAAFLLAACGVTVVDLTIKRVVPRKRPDTTVARVLRLIEQSSFPSGHVMNYVSAFGFLAAAASANLKPSPLRRALVAACGAMIGLIGPARVYLGAHWPSDVAFGYLFGGLYLGATLELYTRAKQQQAKTS